MLTHPLWLSGLLALAIPLALHLWSQRPGRVIRVGSTRHLTDLPPIQRFSLRLTERLLLALRLGVLAALVLALADPRLTLPAPTSGSPIILVAGDVAADSALWLSDPWLDSLSRAGTPLTLLAEGFPALDHAQPLRDTVDRTPLWDRLAEADRRLAPGRPFVVVAPSRLSRLGADRPRLSRSVEWHDVDPATPRWSLAAAWLGPRGDSIELRLREGDSLGSRALRATLGAGPALRRIPDGPAVEIRSEGPARTVRLLAADAETTSVAVTPVRPLALRLAGWSEGASHRLEVAAGVVGIALGQPVRRVGTADSADLVLTSASDTGGGEHLEIPAEWIALPSLPDSLQSRWPLPVTDRAGSDPRLVTRGQLVPATRMADAANTTVRRLRLPLLWLALTLLAVERLLAARRRSSA